ncbi:MAG: bifunctional folylpolyglutamate synthase/dihydrofolate synthase [Actinobacteria bacterium]|nr:bifunctional folylpolyglutamate synthase/dihydrofolate synthase [Actinomycetota bacterium]
MNEKGQQYVESLDKLGFHFGLERIQALIEGLGHPEQAYRTIHVVGTNGKTSTVRFLSSILRAHGHRVGTYISPHLVSAAERQLVDDVPTTEAEFEELVDAVREVAEQVNASRPEDDRITQFEFLSAVAFERFRRAGCDVAVIEAGLGGRLDATSVINSEIQVLTGVGLEHTEFLGDSLKAILEEKAAVIREGGKVMAGSLSPDLRLHLRELCLQRGAMVKLLDEDLSLLDDPAESSFDVFGLYDSYSDLRLGPLGLFQRHNAAVALGAAELFQGQGLEEKALRRALAETTVPGRLEVVSDKPLCLLDGAHNLQGLRALIESLEEILPRRRIIAVVSILRDKDAQAMLAELVPRCDIVFVTGSSNARALTPAELAGMAEQLVEPPGRGPEVFMDDDPCSALRSAYKLATSNQVVLVTGSLYLVGDVKRGLGLWI